MNTTEDSMDMDTSNQTDPQPAPREWEPPGAIDLDAIKKTLHEHFVAAEQIGEIGDSNYINGVISNVFMDLREIQPASDLERELTDASKNCWDNFEGLQVVTDWLVERDAMLTPHEDGGGKESGMNIVASIEALLSAARAEAGRWRTCAEDAMQWLERIAEDFDSSGDESTAKGMRRNLAEMKAAAAPNQSHP